MSAPLGKAPLPAPPALAVRAALSLRRALLRAADTVVPSQLVLAERITATVGSVVIAELCDGRERSRADFDHLLTKGGFRLERALPTPTAMHVLEAFAR